MAKGYKRHDLTTGSISRHVIRMAPPMAVAFLATMIFNIVDTWFVSRLGEKPLAAMGFTFPVVMLVHAVAMGLGLGVSASVSQTLGKGDDSRSRHLASAGLVLCFLVFTCVSAIGLLAMDHIFSLLGAGGETLALTTSYMQVWFCFLPLAVLPMVGNNAIRATGDTLRPSMIMIAGALLNCVLDPLLIFGTGFFPELGIAGAAWATGISRSLTMVLSFIIMRRFGLLAPVWRDAAAVLKEWITIIRVALPATATNLLMPLTNGVITRIIAGFGTAAVAATAAGQRVEMVAFLVPMAMGSALVPLIGQNWGARRLGRVRRSYVVTNWYGFAYTAFCYFLAVPLAPVVAGWFSSNRLITTLISHYLWIMLAGALLTHIVVHTGFALNATERPGQAALLNATRLLGLVLPLAYAGSRLFGVHGVFLGMTAANLTAGVIALYWFLKAVPRQTVDSLKQPLPSNAQEKKADGLRPTGRPS